MGVDTVVEVKDGTVNAFVREALAVKARIDDVNFMLEKDTIEKPLGKRRGGAVIADFEISELGGQVHNSS